MGEHVHVLAIPGSLRAYSFNRALLVATSELNAEDVSIEIYDLHDIPLYNADVEAEGNPVEVARFKDAIREADALLIATPEYNGSISGVLKNAIDWASRPAGNSVLLGKPVSVIGATSGRSETTKARADTERILNSCRAVVLPATNFGLGKAGDYIDEGIVHSPEVEADLAEVIEHLAVFARSHALIAAD